MKVVEKSDGLVQPGMCCISADIGGPFVDLDASLNCERMGINPHLYIHVPVAEQIGRTLGMVPQKILESCEHEVEELRKTVQALEEELSQAQITLDAVDTLKNRGFEQKRGPGRPRKPRHDSEVAA